MEESAVVHELDDIDIGLDTKWLSARELGSDISQGITSIGEGFKRRIRKQRLVKTIEKRIQKEPFLRTIDGITFTFHVGNLVATEFLILRYPQWMWLWYCVLILPLLVMRMAAYSAQKYHYLMLDFPYFVQTLMLFYLFYYPQSSRMFEVVFCVSNGPLIWEILFFRRTSLVLHDMDQMTNVVMIAYPPIVTFTMRWWPRGGDVSLVCSNAQCTLPMGRVILLPLCVFIFWQVCYFLKTEYVDRDRIQRSDLGVTTTYRSYFHNPERSKSIIGKAVSSSFADLIGPILVFMVVQTAMTVVSLLPTKLFFSSLRGHACFLLLTIAVIIWKGAVFYFEAFSTSYENRLRRFQHDQGHLEGELGAASEGSPDHNKKKKKQQQQQSS